MDFAQLAIKGKQSRGNIVTKNEVHRISLKERGASTLGGREVWFDPDVLRLNYDGRGISLGEFNTTDQVLVIYKNGDFCTTSFDSENHYDEGILRIEKYVEGKIWTAVLYDADQGFYYMKRFQYESSSKRQSFIGGNKDSKLFVLSDDRYPRVEVKFGGGDSFREALVIDAEEFIGEKSFKAKGKRLSNFEIATITELEPREVEEDEDDFQSVPEVEGIDDDVEEEPLKSQKDIFDDLTGQKRLFDEE